MRKPAHEILEFVLEKAAAEKPARRAELYRALAAVAPSEHDVRRLTELAAEIEAIETKHNQLLLDFKRACL
jgi:neutral trehalase